MPRRGENIRKRKDGRWEGRYIKNYDIYGKAKYVSVYGKSYLEVKHKLIIAANEIDENTDTHKNKSILFCEVLFLWLENNKIKLKPSTCSKYYRMIEKHLVPVKKSIERSKTMPRESLKNKTPSELREMKAKNEAKIKYMENKIKYFESQEKQLTRKERTHRLCTRGAMLEKFLGCPNELTDEQVEEILKIAFQSEAVSRAIEQLRESNESTTL